MFLNKALNDGSTDVQEDTLFTFFKKKFISYNLRHTELVAFCSFQRTRLRSLRSSLCFVQEPNYDCLKCFDNVHL